MKALTLRLTWALTHVNLTKRFVARLFTLMDTGKKIRVAVFTTPGHVDAATKAGADIVGLDDLAEKVKAGEMDFDYGCCKHLTRCALLDN